MKNILLTSFFTLSLILVITFVFYNFINFEKNISFINYSSKNIITDSEKLNSNYIIFKSNKNISKYKIKTNCKNIFKYIWKKESLYFFEFMLLDNNCENPNFSLTDWKENFFKTRFKLKIDNKYKIVSKIIDFSNDEIDKLNLVLLDTISKYSKYKNNNSKKFSIFKRNRIYKELVYKQEIVSSIINRRSLKYNVPVKGYKITNWLNVIPNAGRPYRKDFTDWIHHWWDIMAPKWTTVSAIDDWLIIRVVKNFKYNDLSNIKKKWYTSYMQKLKNLDILRWNQVWLKTAKWDVMFYSHLGKIYDWIEEWKFVSVWTDLWTIWKSWIPDIYYTNFHLHFPIQKNPYNIEKAWKYTWEDYMAWDWYLKWLDVTAVINWVKDIFVSDALED